MGSSAVLSSEFVDILLDRRSCNDFRWASRPYQPSPYFVKGRARDPKEVCNLVLKCEPVQAAIREVALRENKDEKEIFRRAQDVLSEMAHDYHLYTIRWFALALSKMGKSRFSSIHINTHNLQKIKDCLQRYPVILLPTHRSYVDFLLLSYVCFTYELPLPIIAAGMDFMGMTGVAECLRKAGAFFIRRRFGNDSLYRCLINEYVKKAVLHGAHPLEMFVEGTRSRSGKSLYPKIGLLSAVADLVRQREVPDILILPISMSYDRTLEETLYARELLGQPKPKESTNGLMKGLNWLRSQAYGSIYVNFGELISVRDSLGNNFPSTPDDSVFSQAVQELALQVVLAHQKNLVMPLFPAVSAVILSKLSQGDTEISFPKLVNHIIGFRTLLSFKGWDFGYSLAGETLEKNLRNILSIHSSLVVCPQNEEHIVRFKIGNDETVDAMQFQHYANQFISSIIPYCIFSVIMKNEAEVVSVSEDFLEDYIFLRQLLFDDFLYEQGKETEEATGSSTIFNMYLSQGKVNGHIKQWIAETEEMKFILRTTLEPFILAYWGVAKTLSQIVSRSPEAIEVKQLAKMSQGFLRQLLGTNLPKLYGSLSLDTLNNASMSFIKLGYVGKTKMYFTENPAVIVKDMTMINSLIHRLEKYLPFQSESNKDSTAENSSSSDSNGEEDFGQLLHLKSKL